MFQEVQRKLKDPVFRDNIINNPGKYAEELGYTEKDVEYKVIVCDKNTLYLVFNNNDAQASAVNLEQIQAAGLGSASTVSTIGSVGTVCSTASSVASGGTAGTRA